MLVRSGTRAGLNRSVLNQSVSPQHPVLVRRSLDCLKTKIMFPISFLCFQYLNYVSNIRCMFPIYILCFQTTIFPMNVSNIHGLVFQVELTKFMTQWPFSSVFLTNWLSTCWYFWQPTNWFSTNCILSNLFLTISYSDR